MIIIIYKKILFEVVIILFGDGEVIKMYGEMCCDREKYFLNNY